MNSNYDVYMCRDSCLAAKLKKFIGMTAKDSRKSLEFDQLLVAAYDDGFYVHLIKSSNDGVIRDIEFSPR